MQIYKKTTLIYLSICIIMLVLTILFFFDIKFVIAGLNIFAWDALAISLWLFVRACRWASRQSATKRTLIVIILTFFGLFVGAFGIFALSFNGALDLYITTTELQTHRTFVLEYRSNLLQKGSAKLYERFGPFILPCDAETYYGDISLDKPQTYLSQDGKEIVVSFFFLSPTFYIPVE